MGPYLTFWLRGFSVSRSRAGGLALLMSISGCAHLGNVPSQTSTTGSTPKAPETVAAPDGSAGRGDAPVSPPPRSGASHPADGALAQANSAKAPSNTGGTPKIPSPARGGSDKGQPKAAAPPTLGLSDLEQRLRDTHAIGVFTKLSLKNQIDDLIGQLRAYHVRPTAASLPELRHRYDELLQKVIGLLQSGDPSLAKDISSSREAIWSLLTDSTRISQL